MRKLFLILLFLSIGLGSFNAHAFEFHTNTKTVTRLDEENECYRDSYRVMSDTVLASWTRLLVQEGIDGDPFAMMLFFIDHFSKMPQVRHDNCIALDEIMSNNHTNLRSSAIVTCALMRSYGWDMQCFCNDDEVYLGIHFSDDWYIMGGYQVESDGRTYYLKSFETKSPVGMLDKKNPIHFHRCDDGSERDVKPFPLVQSLPWFSGEHRERALKWQYRNRSYTFNLRIPMQQIRWTQNLPLSLYGMAASGVLELQSTGLPDHLQQLMRGMNEYEKVNFLLKFCQSEGVFRYKEGEPVRSVSEQLHNACNDCDGRSIFMYSLLMSVLDYNYEDIVFVMWPDQLHLALSVRPRTDEAQRILKERGYSTDDGYFILDPAYEGDTYWGSKMDVLSGRMETIKK